MRRRQVEQKVGNITKSKNIVISQQNQAQDGSQIVGDVSDAEDVRIYQVLSQSDNPDQLIQILSDGIRSMRDILSALEETEEKFKDIGKQLKKVASSFEKKNPVDVKLKFAVPIIPMILNVEAEFSISDKLKQLGNKISAFSKLAYLKMLTTVQNIDRENKQE